jgi:hypothetical protein
MWRSFRIPKHLPQAWQVRHGILFVASPQNHLRRRENLPIIYAAALAYRQSAL